MHLRNRAASRRAFLLGTAGTATALGMGALSGCGIFGGPDESPTSNALDAFLNATAVLADRYDATLATHPDLADILTPVRDAHRAHVAAIARAVDRPTPPAGQGASETGDRATVFGALSRAEKAARDEAVKTCLTTAPRLAALVGSIAAARASHLEVLK